MKGKRVRRLVTSALLGGGFLSFGCPWFNMGDGPADPNRFDGKWRVLGENGALYCIAIEENQVVDYVSVCINERPIQDASPGVVLGNAAMWSFNVLFPDQGNVRIDYTLDVKLEPDGSFAGFETTTIVAGGNVGEPETQTVAMTPN